jgi:hypothetical protein
MARTEELNTLANSPLRVKAGRNKEADIEKMRPCIQREEAKISALPLQAIRRVLTTVGVTNKDTYIDLIRSNRISPHYKRIIRRYFFDLVRRSRQMTPQSQTQTENSRIGAQVNNATNTLQNYQRNYAGIPPLGRRGSEFEYVGNTRIVKRNAGSRRTRRNRRR